MILNDNMLGAVLSSAAAGLMPPPANRQPSAESVKLPFSGRPERASIFRRSMQTARPRVVTDLRLAFERSQTPTRHR